MTASAEKRQALNIEFLVHLVERMEERSHDIDGIIEDAATQEILYATERRYA
jgi:hypothetical protein